MKSVRVLAQDIMDLYLQKFADSNDTFFSDLDFYVRQVCDTVAALYDEDYKALYAGLRADGIQRINLVSIDTGWLKKEKAEIKEDKESGYFKASLASSIFAFTWDKSEVGLQGVSPVRRDECKLVRTTLSSLWVDEHIYSTDVVFYWKDEGDIWFNKGCCKSVYVHYLPSPNEGMIVPEGKADEVKKRVLNIMLAAKSGTPVTDETNDSNANVSQQTETNNQTI